MDQLRPPDEDTTWVYLDWNVFSHIADGVLEEEVAAGLLELRLSGEVVFPYQREHVIEALRGDMSWVATGQLDPRVERRVQVLADLTGGAHLSSTGLGGSWFLSLVSPWLVVQQVADEIKPNPEVDELLVDVAEMLRTVTNEALAQMEESSGESLSELFVVQYDRSVGVGFWMQRTALSLQEAARRIARRAPDQLGIDLRELGQMGAKDVLPFIEGKLEALGSGFSLDAMTAWAEENTPTLVPDAAMRNMSVLSTAGYKRDKPGVGTTSVMSDAVHFALAGRCDVFVTGDRRLAQRARAAIASVGGSCVVLGPHELWDLVRPHIVGDVEE